MFELAAKEIALQHLMTAGSVTISRIKSVSGWSRKVITIVDVRGFLFAKTMQQPKSTAWVNISTVSELAEQSTKAKPVARLSKRPSLKWPYLRWMNDKNH